MQPIPSNLCLAGRTEEQLDELEYICIATDLLVLH
jgi:hypothetical protein